MHRLFHGVAVVVALTVATARHPPAPGVSAPETVAVNGVFEATFDLSLSPDAPPNVEWVAPSGARTWTETFPWHGRRGARFSPGEPGTYRFFVHAGAASAVLARGAFRSVDRGLPGRVRVDPLHPHQLSFPDGRVFHVLGENRMNVYDPLWNEGALGPAAYVQRMAAEGMTTLRVFVVTDAREPVGPDGQGTRPGVLEPRLGVFDEQVADAFDDIFRAAERSGVYVVLVPFALGFTPDGPWKGWAGNPYNAARGGPARTRDDFFLDPKAMALEEQRFKYVATRWGAFSHFLAVDLLNEPEWDGAIPESIWMPWARRMADAWRRVDPYPCLVTVGSAGRRKTTGSDDVAQWHLYGPPFYEVHALARQISSEGAATRRYDKPVWLGEFAYGGEPKPAYDHTHVGLWTATFAGLGVLAHSAPQFSLDSDEPMTAERASHFTALRRFLDSLGPRRFLEPLATLAGVQPPRAQAWRLGSADAQAVWLLANPADYEERLDGLALTLDGVAAGRYQVRWWDDSRGEVIAAREVTAGASPLVLEVPAFRRHVALSLQPLEPR